MAPTVSDVLEIAGTSRDSFNNWLRRGLLREDIPETTPGVARQMTRAAALELAFVAALTDVGFDAAEAASRARVYVARERIGKLDGWFVYEPVGEHEFYCGDQGARTPISSAMAMFEDGTGKRVSESGSKLTPATRFVVVHLAEIVRRIDGLFPAAG